MSEIEKRREFESIVQLFNRIDGLGVGMEVPPAILRAGESLRLAVMRALHDIHAYDIRRRFVDLGEGADQLMDVLQRVMHINIEVPIFGRQYSGEIEIFCNSVRSELIPLLRQVRERDYSLKNLMSDKRSMLKFLPPVPGAVLLTGANMWLCVIIVLRSFLDTVHADNGGTTSQIDSLLTLAAASMPIWFKVPQRAHAFCKHLKSGGIEIDKFNEVVAVLEAKLDKILSDGDPNPPEEFIKNFFLVLETRRQLGWVGLAYQESPERIKELVDGAAKQITGAATS